MALPGRAGTRGRGKAGAAAVAGPAGRRVLLSEVPPKKHASAPLGLGVIGDGRESARAGVTECLELRHEIAGASSEGLERYREDDAALLIVLDEAGLLKIREQCIANPYRYAGRERERGGRGGSVLARPSGERALDPSKVPDIWTTQGLEPFLDLEVGRVE